HALVDGDEVHHGPAAAFVTGCGDEAGWLVEHEIALLLAADGLAIDTDLILRWMHACTELGDDFAVHLHPSLNNELLGGAPACDAPLREHALQSLSGWRFVLAGRLIRPAHHVTCLSSQAMSA